MFYEAMEFLRSSESHDIGIMILDETARVVFSNTKAKLLYTVTDGTKLPEGTNLYSSLKQCLEQKKTLSGLLLHEPGVEHLSSLSLYAYPLSNTSNGPLLLVIILDSNPLHQYFKSQAAYEKLNLIGKMGAATANVILNPLAVIKGTLQLMEQHFNTHTTTIGLSPSPVHEKMQRYFQMIQNEIKTIDKHIQRFILIGKPVEIRLNRIQILPFLDRVIPAVRMKALEKGLRFVCEYPASDGEILGHSIYLEDALHALLQNAMDATEVGGSVTFRTELTEKEARFLIIDHGHGIPPDIIPQIGDPFVTTKNEALGLGLSYSYQIIQKMGGTLKIHPLPAGTQVEVSLSRVT